MIDLTTLNRKELWQEIVRRTANNDGEFTPEEQAYIARMYPNRQSRRKEGTNRIPVKATDPIGNVHYFTSIHECARFTRAHPKTISQIIEMDKVKPFGKLRGWRIEYDEDAANEPLE